MSSLLSRYVSRLAMLLCLGTVACQQSEMGSKSPAPATKSQVEPNNNGSTNNPTYKDVEESYDDDDEEDRNEDQGQNLVQACETRGGTYVEGEGCMVCESENAKYDATEKQCVSTTVRNGETAVKVVGGVFTILDGILKNTPTGGGDDYDDECDEC